MVLNGAILALAMLPVAACGSGGGPPAGTVPPSGPVPPRSAAPSPVLTVCQDVATLRAALHGLTSVSIGQGPVSEVSAAGRAIQASLSDLSRTAGTEWQAQVGDLRSELEKLQSAAASLTASPSAHGQSTVTSAVASVAASGRRLLAAIGNRCPSPSPGAPSSS